MYTDVKRRGQAGLVDPNGSMLSFFRQLVSERIFQTFPESKVPRPTHFFSGDATRPHHASNASMLKLSSHLDPFGYMVASRAQRGPLHVVKRSRIALTARQNPHHHPFSPITSPNLSRLKALLLIQTLISQEKHFAQPLLHTNTTYHYT